MVVRCLVWTTEKHYCKTLIFAFLVCWWVRGNLKYMCMPFWPNVGLASGISTLPGFNLCADVNIPVLTRWKLSFELLQFVGGSHRDLNQLVVLSSANRPYLSSFFPFLVPPQLLVPFISDLFKTIICSFSLNFTCGFGRANIWLLLRSRPLHVFLR